MHAKTLVVVLLLAFCGLAAAAKYDATQVVTARTKAEFAQQATQVRKELQAGGRYEFVQVTERVTVERRLSEIQSLFDAYVEGTRLQDTQLMALLNAQEEINGILTKRDGQRLVCAVTTPTGSHRTVNNCKRYSDVERSHRDNEKAMRDFGAVKQECANPLCMNEQHPHYGSGK